jgi:predicted dehydrogenase
LIRTAVIGAGNYAGFMIDRMLELPERYAVAAIVSRRGINDQRVASCQQKGAQIVSSAGALWGSIHKGNCDAVMVPTGIDTHFGFAAEALKRGFHVILEKPPVPTIQELDELIELQKTVGRSVAVGFQFLYIDSATKTKQLLASGALGKICRVRATAAWPRSVEYMNRSSWSGKLRTADGWVLDGTVGNPLAHLLAQSLYFASPSPGLATPLSIQAELYRANDIESEDTSSLRLETSDGVTVFFHGTLASEQGRVATIEVETEGAIIRQVDFAETTLCWRDGRREIITKSTLPKEHQDMVDRRVMLTAIADAIDCGARQAVDLAACRPYLLAWNGAFESNGLPRGIPPGYKKMAVQNGQRFIAVGDLDRFMEETCQSGRHFSEAGISWATPSQVFDLRGYDHFPQHRDLVDLSKHETIRKQPS